MSNNAHTAQFTATFSHDKDGFYPTWQTMHQVEPVTFSDALAMVRKQCATQGTHAAFFWGDGVLIADGGHVVGTDIEAAAEARTVTPGGQSRRLHF